MPSLSRRQSNNDHVAKEMEQDTSIVVASIFGIAIGVFVFLLIAFLGFFRIQRMLAKRAKRRYRQAIREGRLANNRAGMDSDATLVTEPPGYTTDDPNEDAASGVAGLSVGGAKGPPPYSQVATPGTALVADHTQSTFHHGHIRVTVQGIEMQELHPTTRGENETTENQRQGANTNVNGTQQVGRRPGFFQTHRAWISAPWGGFVVY